MVSLPALMNRPAFARLEYTHLGCAKVRIRKPAFL
jgi:hypothetical protein